MTLQNRVTPFGVFEADPARGTLMGNRGAALRAWTHAGYAERRSWPAEPVTVLTPPSTIAAMCAGWRPELHPSARP